MRNPVVAAAAGVILVALAVVPAAAAALHPIKPSLETSACVNGEQLRVRSDWFNQDVVNPAIGPTFTWTFKGPGLPASPATIPFIGPTLDDSYVQVDLNKFLGESGLIDWNDWSSITTSATGSFTDTAHAVRQPKTGWPACA